MSGESWALRTASDYQLVEVGAALRARTPNSFIVNHRLRSTVSTRCQLIDPNYCPLSPTTDIVIAVFIYISQYGRKYCDIWRCSGLWVGPTVAADMVRHSERILYSLIVYLINGFHCKPHSMCKSWSHFDEPLDPRLNSTIGPSSCYSKRVLALVFSHSLTPCPLYPLYPLIPDLILAFFLI